MYTILINNDNTLTKTVTTNIMHRSSMIDGIRFLLEPIYKSNDETYDMATFTCTLECKLPSGKYIPKVLTPSSELYKGHIEYILPIDIELTSEVGDVDIKFTFTRLDMNGDGSKIERVRKTSSTTITILPAEQWSDYIPDTDLDAIAQLMLTIQSKQNHLDEAIKEFESIKADNNGTDEDISVEVI